MTQYVRGNLDSKQNANNVRLFFAIIMCFCLGTYTTYVWFCCHTYEGMQLVTMETVNSCFNLMFNLILFVCYLKSMMQLRKAIK